MSDKNSHHLARIDINNPHIIEWNRKDSVKPLKRLWKSMMGVQPLCTVAAVCPYQSNSFRRKRFNLGMLDNTVECIELHWLVDSLVRSIHCSILGQGRVVQRVPQLRQ